VKKRLWFVDEPDIPISGEHIHENTYESTDAIPLLMYKRLFG
jgi:hypothetical protein